MQGLGQNSQPLIGRISAVVLHAGLYEGAQAVVISTTMDTEDVHSAPRNNRDSRDIASSLVSPRSFLFPASSGYPAYPVPDRSDTSSSRMEKAGPSSFQQLEKVRDSPHN